MVIRCFDFSRDASVTFQSIKVYFLHLFFKIEIRELSKAQIKYLQITRDDCIIEQSITCQQAATGFDLNVSYRAGETHNNKNAKVRS